MSLVAFVQLSAGGVIEHTMADVPQDGDRWSSSPAPAVWLYNDTGGLMLSGATATEGPSTSTSEGVSAGATDIPLVDLTGVERFAEYSIGPSATGSWERVTTIAAGGGQVTVAAPIRNAYAAGVAFRSHRLTYQVSSSTANSVMRNCRAEWRYTVDGVQRRESTIFHVSRYAPRCPLTSETFFAEYPRGRNMIASSQHMEILIKEMWRGVVLPEIGRLFHPGALASGEAARPLLAAKLKQILCETARDFQAADIYQERWRAELELLRDTIVDLDEDGEQTEIERVPSPLVAQIRRC